MGCTKLSFVADAKTVGLIDEMKVELNARTEAEVFRKALALARLAADRGRSSDGVVVLSGGRGTGGQGVTIDLRG